MKKYHLIFIHDPIFHIGSDKTFWDKVSLREEEKIMPLIVPATFKGSVQTTLRPILYNDHQGNLTIYLNYKYAPAIKLCI